MHFSKTLEHSASIIMALVGAIASLGFFVVVGELGFEVSIFLISLPILASMAIIIAARYDLKPPLLNWLLERAAYFIIVLMLISAALRLAVAFSASYYPDEYQIWAILRTHPWTNLVNFLQHYDRIAGPQRGHPPLGIVLMSFGYEILGSMEGARIVSIVFALASIPIVYWLVATIQNRITALYATSFFAMLPQSVVFQSLALTDGYLFFFGLLALAIFLYSVQHSSKNALMISGVVLGLAFWTKGVIPFLWAFAICLAAFFYPRLTRIRRLVWASFVILIGGLVYGLWDIVSPVSFAFPLGVALRAISGRVNLGGSSFNISYFDLVSQLAGWWTLPLIFLALTAVYISLRNRESRGIWLTMWLLVPIIVMIFQVRDIRYLLVSSVALAALGVNGGSVLPHTSRKRTIGVVFVFLLIGSIGLMPVIAEEYSGVRDAGQALADLGFTRGTILTNVMEISFYLPNVQLINLNTYGNVSSVQALLEHGNVIAVVLVHQQRDTWFMPRPEVLNWLVLHFSNKLIGGRSHFSWYEILYSTFPHYATTVEGGCVNWCGQRGLSLLECKISRLIVNQSKITQLR